MRSSLRLPDVPLVMPLMPFLMMRVPHARFHFRNLMKDPWDATLDHPLDRIPPLLITAAHFRPPPLRTSMGVLHGPDRPSGTPPLALLVELGGPGLFFSHALCLQPCGR